MAEIYIVTPAYNSRATIDETIASVVLQAGDFSVHYHVQDGGSTDGTVDLLEKWSKRLNSGALPVLCNNVRFSYVSEQDDGMYDAIRKGFSRFAIPDNEWMTWINSDDVLAPGAFAVISYISKKQNQIAWVTGRAAVRTPEMQIAEADRYLTREIIKQGLSDGKHWGFLQQEGTFFRGRLWAAVDIPKQFCTLKYAGDWNLWRKFAEIEDIYQYAFPLAYFSIRPGQLSQIGRDKYEAEIDAIAPMLMRLGRFNALAPEKLTAKWLAPDYATKHLKIQEKQISKHYQYWQGRLAEAEKSVSKIGPVIDSSSIDINKQQVISSKFVCTDTIVAYNKEWQFPAITEKHAYIQAEKLLVSTPGAVYFAFPWATLIDLLNNKKPDGERLKSVLLEAKALLSSAKHVVTVCQHVLMLNFQDLFQELGVTDIFWTHAIRGQNRLPKYAAIKVHPFPLFPVQMVKEEIRPSKKEEKFLFSFVGARSNKWYLTDCRELIIDHLGADEQGLVIGRDQWHYNDVVYKHQVNNQVLSGREMVNSSASAEFQDVLRDSLFSLCPSGSGPNSIRLWESLGCGAIPVVLADTYLPPGNIALWNEAVVFCKENLDEIKALPDRLAEMRRDPESILQKRNAMRQLWAMYGPDFFIYDILRLFVAIANEIGSIDKASESFDILRELSMVINSTEADIEASDILVLSSITRVIDDAKKFSVFYKSSPDYRRALKTATEICSLKYSKQLHILLQRRNIVLDSSEAKNA